MNWGYKLVVAMAAFIVFIIGMGIAMFGAKDDVLANDYYEQDLRYQATLDAQKNFQALGQQIAISYVAERKLIQIQYPTALEMHLSQGKIALKKASDANADLEIPIQPTNNQQFIPITEKGSWHLYFQWQAGGKPYHYEYNLIVQ